MSDIFISYSRQDLPLAKVLAEKLTAVGWDVWWDNRIVAGSYFRKTIEENLHSASSVIVIWSAFSINSDFVIDEAKEALNNGKLVPIQVGDINPPLGFRSIHYVKWNENDQIEEEEFNELVLHLKQKMVETKFPINKREIVVSAYDKQNKSAETKQKEEKAHNQNLAFTKLASKRYRFIAATIDFIIFFIIYCLVLAISGVDVKQTDTASKNQQARLLDLSLGILLVYMILSEGLTGQTLGKKILNIKVVREDSTKLSLINSFVRHLFDVVDIIFFVGLIIASLNSKKQRLGDLIAKTIVISKG